MSLFIDSGAGLVLSIWFVSALNSKNNFMIAKLTIWAWCGVAIMNRLIIYMLIKQLNYVWLTAEITVEQLRNTSNKFYSILGTLYSFHYVVLVCFIAMS